MQLDKDDHLAAAATLRTLVDRLTGEKKISEAWRSLAQTLSAVSNLPEEYTPKVLSAKYTNICPLRSFQLYVGKGYSDFILEITMPKRKQMCFNAKYLHYQLQEALEHNLNDSVLGDNETNYQNYLRLLYRTGQRTKLVTAAQDMAKIFPTYLPLEWICRMYVEWIAYPKEGEGKNHNFYICAEKF